MTTSPNTRATQISLSRCDGKCRSWPLREPHKKTNGPRSISRDVASRLMVFAARFVNRTGEVSAAPSRSLAVFVRLAIWAAVATAIAVTVIALRAAIAAST